MYKLLTCIGVFFVIFACHALPTLAGLAIEINSASYSQDTKTLSISGMNFIAFGVPLISIGDTPLLDSCTIQSSTIIECDLSTTLAISGGSFPVKVSAGNAPHVNAKIDVYIPSPNQVFQCNQGDMVTCYSDIPTTINVGECVSGYRLCGGDGNWGECLGAVTPVDELCDGLDNDCDTEVDEDAVDAQVYYRDFDGDGFGVNSDTLTLCESLPGYTTVVGDCDDTSQDVYPGNAEFCNNGIDDNCSGQIDELCVFTDCQPGEYILSEGTETSDRICSTCPLGSYSDTSNVTNCNFWTVCAGDTCEITPGTSTSDKVCGTCQTIY